MNLIRKNRRQKLCVVFGVILALILIILLGARLYLRIPVKDYYTVSEKAFVIPGLPGNLVPQGISFDEETDLFLITGYQKDQTVSPIYLVDHATGEVRDKVLLLAPDGSDFVFHAGGLSVLGDYVYVAGGSDACLYVYDRSAVLDSEDGTHIPCLGTFDIYFGADDEIAVAFTTTHDGSLTVGEFYRDPNYLTPDSHKFTTPAGDYHQALAVTYAASDEPDAIFGLSPVPVEAYTLPDLTQGMAFYDGNLWLSTSYGMAFSNIYAYEQSALQPFSALPAGSGEIPLYALDTAAMSGHYRFPPMSEEIEFVDGKMYTMCESASNLYIFGKLTGGRWCYATPMEELE